jgi:hypothetical protein
MTTEKEKKILQTASVYFMLMQAQKSFSLLGGQ